MIRSLLFRFYLLMPLAAVAAGSESPIWKLDAESFPKVSTEGDIICDGTSVHLNGQNSFTLPGDVLTNQDNYTVEFEVKRPADTEQGHRLTLVSNLDESAESGFELISFPPAYNAMWLMINGYQNDEKRSFLTDETSHRLTFVVKDRAMHLFRDGSLLSMTEPIEPSALPLRFGKVETKPTKPYEISNVAVYDGAHFPEGFDEHHPRPRTYSGDMYKVQRVAIDDPELPRVLVIGDSISMGYRTRIAKLLEGRAYLDYWTQNYWHEMLEGENSPLERALTGVVSEGPYDLITFNFGLHSWGRPDRSPEEKYEEQETKLLEHLEKIAPDTEWVWIRTTPLTKNLEDGTSVLDPEKNDRIARFNEMTDSMIEEHGITSVDLYGLCLENLNGASRDGVHWNREVYDLMGDEITEVIETKLGLKKPTN